LADSGARTEHARDSQAFPTYVDLSGHRQRQQLLEIWNSKASDRIPTSRRIPTCVWNDTRVTGDWLACLTISTIASYGATGGDIGEAFEADAVEPGVEVAELFLAGAETGVVEEGNDRGEDGRGGRSSAGEATFIVDDDGVTVSGSSG